MNAVELEKAYNYYKNDLQFNAELMTFSKLCRKTVSPLLRRKWPNPRWCKLYLKREDLNHTGSHKINNVLGRCFWREDGQDPRHC